jgi:hypothetical protein
MPDDWKPFRPGPGDLERIAGEVAAIPKIQADLVAGHPDLTAPDRGAHQYQVAGSKVTLEIDAALPAELAGVDLFVPGAVHHGIARLSTGLGYPHLETDPDFLGLMAAFRTGAGQRVDFLAINDPTSPAENHRYFVTVLEATAAAAGAEPPFGGKAGTLDLLDLAAVQTEFARALVGAMGIRGGLRTLGHIAQQTLITARSSTAFQTYWTGVVEIGGSAGKVVFVPSRDENPLRELHPGERHLTEEWRRRQAAGEVVFQVCWLPFVSQEETSTERLTEPWAERRQPLGRLRFPRSAPDSEEASLWAALAAEMGANPGNWVRDRNDRTEFPGTEFGTARQMAYRASQQGRDVLPEGLYEDVFTTGRIGVALADELRRRRAAKQAAGHVDGAPATAKI